MPVEECWIQSWYVPAAVSCVSTENVCPGLLLIDVWPSIEPEGETTFMVADGFVTFVAYTPMCWGAAAVKFRRTSCPATAVVAVTTGTPTDSAGVNTSEAVLT